MVKTGVRSGWKNAVKKSGSTLGKIGKYGGVSSGSTSAAPFRNIGEIAGRYDDSVKRLGSYAAVEERKMIQAAENKVKDDRSYRK